MLPYPEIDPVAISIGPLDIHWYGIMYLGGFLGGWWLLRRRAAKGVSRFSAEQVDDLVFYTVLGVILGGRIGYALFYQFDAYARDPLAILRIWEGGMSFHGGLLGVMAAMWLYRRKAGQPFLALTDALASVVPIGLGLGRVGNFINGELWGAPTDLPWGMVYQGVARHPSQLYELILEGVVLFAVLWWFTSRERPIGAASGLFAILYGVFRIAVEFVRLPDAHIGYLAFGWVTMGQVLSLPLLVLGIWLFVRAYRDGSGDGSGEAAA